MLRIPNWFWGILLSVCSAGLTALGLVTQKYSHQQNEKAGSARRVFYQQFWWRVGFAIFVAGQIANIPAMALTPQTMLSCLGGLSLVFNTAYAHILLGERLRAPEVLAMSTMILGATLVVTSTPVHDHHSVYAGDILANVLHVEFLVGAAAICVVLVTLGVVSTYRTAELRPLFWALSCASCGSYSVTLFKCGAELAASTSRCWLRWEMYALGAVAVLVCLVQVHTLQLALKHSEVVKVMPRFFALGVLFSLMQAQLAFGELRDLSGPTAILSFVIGVILVVGSIIAIVHTQADIDDDKVMYDDGDEEKMTLLSKRRTASEPTLRRNSWSLNTLAISKHNTSFDEIDSFFTVSLTGPMGIA